MNIYKVLFSSFQCSEVEVQSNRKWKYSNTWVNLFSTTVCVLISRLDISASWTRGRELLAWGWLQIQGSFSRCLHQSKETARDTMIYAPDKFISAPNKKTWNICSVMQTSRHPTLVFALLYDQCVRLKGWQEVNMACRWQTWLIIWKECRCLSSMIVIPVNHQHTVENLQIAHFTSSIHLELDFFFFVGHISL